MYGSPPAKDLNRSHQMSSGLLRYRSAPSSLLGEFCEDFMPIRPSSPDTESMFARFLSPELKNPPPTSASAGAGCGYPPQRPPAPPVSAAEENLRFASAAMMYQHQNRMVPSSSSSMAMDHEPIQLKNAPSCSNLIRQNSSPAGLFSNLHVDNGYGVMRGIAGNNSTRLKSQLSYSSRQSSLMSHISEMENESYQINSWEESPILSENNFPSGLKRPRENHTEQSRNGEVRNGLSHQFSLPKTSSEIAAIEKFLQFQDSVPCKIRAKRGCATHPRSIAERVRRTRISERMRKLQQLVPNMDKQTNTADMLDLAVDYIKDLQRQVKNLSDSRANCTCSCSKQKPYINPI